MMIVPAISLEVMNENFIVTDNGSELVGDNISSFASMKLGAISWKCLRCDCEGKTQTEPFATTLRERVNAHWYCRCSRGRSENIDTSRPNTGFLPNTSTTGIDKPFTPIPAPKPNKYTPTEVSIFVCGQKPKVSDLKREKLEKDAIDMYREIMEEIDYEF